MEPLPARFTAGPPGPVNSQGIQSAICSYVEKVARNPGKSLCGDRASGPASCHGFMAGTAGTPIVTSRDMKAENIPGHCRAAEQLPVHPGSTRLRQDPYSRSCNCRTGPAGERKLAFHRIPTRPFTTCCLVWRRPQRERT